MQVKWIVLAILETLASAVVPLFDWTLWLRVFFTKRINLHLSNNRKFDLCDYAWCLFFGLITPDHASTFGALLKGQHTKVIWVCIKIETAF